LQRPAALAIPSVRHGRDKRRRRDALIVSHLHRFIFIKTRKTAGTSIEIALARHCGEDDVITPISAEDEPLRLEWGGRGPQNFERPEFSVNASAHSDGRVIRRGVGADVWNSYFKFAVERNPWDATVSYYHYRFRERPPIPFSEFVLSPRVERLASNQGKIRINGKLCVDFVCRYESLEQELKSVWSRLGLPGDATLPSAKSGLRPPGDRVAYRDYYTPAERDRVADLFAKTIRDFGYEF